MQRKPTGRGIQLRRGGALLVALVCIVVLTAVVLVALQLATSQNRAVQLRKGRLQALQAAEAGVAVVHAGLDEMAALVAREEGEWTVEDGDVFEGDLTWGRYSVTAQAIPDTENWRLVSTGTVSAPLVGELERSVEVVLRAISKQKNVGLFPMGLFADVELVAHGNFFSDSFDSREGPYTPAPHEGWGRPHQGSRGHIGSNERLSVTGGSSEVHGDVQAGPGIDPAFGGLSEGDVGSLPSPVDLLRLGTTEWNAAAASNDNDEINGQSAGGVYDPSTMALNVDSRSVAVLGSSDGRTRTYAFTSVDTRGNGMKIQVVGPVEIYLSGNWTMRGSGSINTEGSAGDLVIWGIGGGTITMNGARAGAFAIYAPDKDITQNGWSDLFGAIVGRTITLNGGPQFHYDEALGEMGGGSEPVVIGFELAGWLEHSTSAPAAEEEPEEGE